MEEKNGPTGVEVEPPKAEGTEDSFATQFPTLSAMFHDMFSGTDENGKTFTEFIGEALSDAKREQNGVCEHEMAMRRTGQGIHALIIAALNDITSPHNDKPSDRDVFECVAIIRTLRALTPRAHFHFH